MEIDQINSAAGKQNEEEIDSDAELEAKESKEQKFEVNHELNEAAIPDGAMVLVCNPGCAQALTRIIFHGEMNEIGKVKVTYKEKTNDALTVFQAQKFVLIHLDESL